MANYEFKTDPVPAPRMVYSDRYAKRPIVMKYFAFRDELKYLSYLNGFPGVPSAIESLTFNIAMPVSWSQKKRLEMNGKPHCQTPDIDNVYKGFSDSVCGDGDSHIHTIGNLKKIWSTEGSINITIQDNEPVKSEAVQAEFFGEAN